MKQKKMGGHTHAHTRTQKSHSIIILDSAVKYVPFVMKYFFLCYVPEFSLLVILQAAGAGNLGRPSRMGGEAWPGGGRTTALNSCALGVEMQWMSKI